MTKTAAKNYFYRLLARRDYTSGELTEKGLNKGFEGSDVKTCVQELMKENLVNDLRFAQNLTDQYKGRKGKIWVSAKLIQHKVPRELIEQVMSEFESLVDDNMKRRVMSKYNLSSWGDIDPKLKQKIVNYLARQGYSNAYSILDSWVKGD